MLKLLKNRACCDAAEAGKKGRGSFLVAIAIYDDEGDLSWLGQVDPRGQVAGDLQRLFRRDDGQNREYQGLFTTRA